MTTAQNQDNQAHLAQSAYPNNAADPVCHIINNTNVQYNLKSQNSIESQARSPLHRWTSSLEKMYAKVPTRGQNNPLLFVTNDNFFIDGVASITMKINEKTCNYFSRLSEL
jgi:hypothetical protein